MTSREQVSNHMPDKRKQPVPSTPKKQKAFEQKYISPQELAVRWAVSPSAIYAGKCGARLLRRITLGPRTIRFLLKEVIELEEKKNNVAA